MPTIIEVATDAIQRLEKVETETSQLPALRQSVATLRIKVDACHLAAKAAADATIALEKLLPVSLSITAVADTDWSDVPMESPFQQGDIVYRIHALAKLSTGRLLRSDEVSMTVDLINKNASSFRYRTYTDLANPFITEICLTRDPWIYGSLCLFQISATHKALQTRSLVALTPTANGDKVG